MLGGGVEVGVLGGRGGGGVTKKGLYIYSGFAVRLAPGVPGISQRSPAGCAGEDVKYKERHCHPAIIYTRGPGILMRAVKHGN